VKSLSDEEQVVDDLDPALLIEQAAAAQEAGEETIAARIYNAAGNIYMSVAEFEEALVCFEKSLDLYNKLKDETGISDTVYNLGVAQINLERWSDAIETCQKAMDLFQKLGNKDGAADALYGVALASLGQGDFDKAMDFFKKATLVDIGNAYQDQQNAEQAEKTFKKALKIYRELEDNAGVADVLSLLGEIAETEGNVRKAAECFVEAAQCYLNAEIFDISREVIDRAEQMMWDVPKGTRRRLRPTIDDVRDALPEQDVMDDDDFDGELPELGGTE
jgi:tetratricopeptide (TPR) repeat protein